MQRTVIFAILTAICLVGCAQPAPERPLPTSVGAAPLADAPSWQPPPHPLAPRVLPQDDTTPPAPSPEEPSPSSAAPVPASKTAPSPHRGPAPAPQQRFAPAPALAPRPQPAAPRPPARDKSGLPNLNIPPHEIRGRIEDAVPEMPAVPAPAPVVPAPAPPPLPLPPAPRMPSL